MDSASTALRAVILCGLADRSRLALLEQLADGPRRVSDLVDATGLAQSNVSRHLACLHDCGLVDRDRHGREVHYRLAEGAADLLAAADAILARTGERIVAGRRFSAPGSRPRTDPSAGSSPTPRAPLT